MIAISKDDNAYLVYSASREQNYFGGYKFGKTDFLDDDNTMAWKIIGSDNCIMMCEFLRENDVLKYCTNLCEGVKGPLDILAIKSKILPAIKQALFDAGELEDAEQKTKGLFFIAQGNKAFLVGENGNVIGIEGFHTYSRLFYWGYAYLHKHKDLPVTQLLQKTGEYIERTTGGLVFPLVMMDTKEQKHVLIERPSGEQI